MSRLRTDPLACRPIGVFDSGIGGLTVLGALRARLPGERLIYLGDTARTPYGTKSPDVVRRYSLENAAFLLDRGVKLLVVACNSSSAVAVGRLRETCPVPVVDVIEPGARAAAAATRVGRVGVIGTEATIRSGGYTRALRRLLPGVEVYTRACPLFVPLAEEGWVANEVARAAARRYLESLRHSGIDTLILGCTHYPLLRGVIAEVLGPGVRLVDSAAATAAAVEAALREGPGLHPGPDPGEVSFFVTDAPDRFVAIGSRFFGMPLDSAVQVDRRGSAEARRAAGRAR